MSPNAASASSRLRIAVATCRVVGLRFGDGLVTSARSREATWDLRLVIGAPAGVRRGIASQTAVEHFRFEHGVPTIQTSDTSLASMMPILRQEQVHVLFVVGWPFRIDVSAVPVGMEVIGLHPRQLPQGRGRSPIPWTIASGDPQTAVTAFKLTSSLDSGPVLMALPTTVGPLETSTDLLARIEDLHESIAPLLAAGVCGDSLTASVQDERRAQYWPERGVRERLLRTSMATTEVELVLRAQTPPFPPPIVSLNGELRPVDAKSTLRLLDANTMPPSVSLGANRLQPFVCEDGEMLVVVGESSALAGA